MTSVVVPLLALLLGTSLFVTGSGLLGTALALNATALGFSSSLTGAVMAAYFAGFVVGTYVCPKIVMRAGHVRAFSAFAATTAAAVLMHALVVSAPVWGLLRFASGVCIVGLYMVVESWLNERSTNEARGRVFAIYQVISLLALAAGQYLILLDGAAGESFIIAGALFSVGLVPIVLTRVPHPAPITSVRLDLRGLWRISPLGVAGTLAAALTNGALFALGPVFARRAGLGTAEVALFMSLVLLGGVALQWPIGHLSDRWDRRRVILGVAAFGAAAAAFGSAVLAHSVAGLLTTAFLYGGPAFSLYPLCVAHSNDRVEAANFVATSSGLLLIYGIGAALGPLLAGPLMQFLGPSAFLAFFAAMHAALALVVLVRMSLRAAPPLSEQERFHMLGRTSQSALEMLAAAEDGSGEPPHEAKAEINPT